MQWSAEAEKNMFLLGTDMTVTGDVRRGREGEGGMQTTFEREEERVKEERRKKWIGWYRGRHLVHLQ